MKVKCVFNTGKALRPYEDKPLESYEFGKFGASEFTRFSIEVGVEYLVMGIILEAGNLNYLVNDGRVIASIPHQLFEIIDSKLPSNWHFRAFSEGGERFPAVDAIWGYYELCYENGHFEQLLEMDEEAHRIYFRQKIELEKALAE